MLWLILWTVACLAAAVWAVRRWTPPSPRTLARTYRDIDLGCIHTAGQCSGACEDPQLPRATARSRGKK